MKIEKGGSYIIDGKHSILFHVELGDKTGSMAPGSDPREIILSPPRSTPEFPALQVDFYLNLF